MPLVKRTSVLTYTSLGFSLGYFLVDALLVTWFMPAVRLSLPLIPCSTTLAPVPSGQVVQWTGHLTTGAE